VERRRPGGSVRGRGRLDRRDPNALGRSRDPDAPAHAAPAAETATLRHPPPSAGTAALRRTRTLAEAATFHEKGADLIGPPPHTLFRASALTKLQLPQPL